MQKLLVSLLILISLSGCFSDDDIQFYTFEKIDQYQKATQVPLKTGLHYGWIMKAPTGKSVHWKEQLILPKTPESWKDKTPYNNMHFTERIEEPQQSGLFPGNKHGLIGNFWQVEQGDPEGIYIFKIYIDGELAKQFNIEFFKPKKKDPS